MMQSSAGSELETEYVYVLKLEEGKFYVGKSKDVHERLRAHRKGAQEWAWTAKYKPVPGDDAILYRGVVQHNTHEDAVTKEMMSKYGIDNLRGGTYSQVKLPEHQERTLKDEKCTWEGLCFVCMEKGHMSRFCPNIPRHRRAFRHAFEASPEPGRREDASTSRVDDLTKSVRNMRVKPTCGDSGGKTQLGEPCRSMQIGKECKRCYWHCNDAKCKFPKHIATRNRRSLA